MRLRDLLGNGTDRPPAPEMADADDIAKYADDWARANPLEAQRGRQSSFDAEEAPFAKASDEVARNVKHKAEFPWLYDPSHGVRWDFSPIQLRNLSQTNTWVGMLVQTISKEISETPWTIVGETGRAETQKRLATHPEKRQPIAKQEGAELPDAQAEDIHDLLMRPNPDDTWQDMVEMWMGDLLEIGSLGTVKAFHRRAYGEDDRLALDADQIKPRALQPTAPEVWTKDYHERTGIVDGYWQFDDHRSPGSGDPDGSTVGFRGGGSPDFFDSAEMLWTDMTPRTNRRYGIPPTLLVEDFLQSLDLAITQEQQYLSRGSIPSGAWVFEEWDREHMKERRQEMEENVKGKPHKSLMFAGQGGDVRFEAMSMNFQELEFTERMKWYARVVASAFQVPTAVVGIEPERVNYNTFQGERENFESNTLGPYLQKLERVINQDLIRPHWGADYRFEFKPGMSESTRKMISERVTREFNAGVRTRNEVRREIGLPEVEDDEDEGFKSEVATPDAGEEGGGPEESFFSHTEIEKAPEGIPDDAFTVDSPDECSGTTVEGERGGLWCVPEDADGDGGDGGSGLDEFEPGEELTADDLAPGDEPVINGDEAEVLELGETDQGEFVRFNKGDEEYVIFADMLDIEAPGDPEDADESPAEVDDGDTVDGVTVGDTFEFDDAPGGEVLAIDEETSTVLYEDAETGEERVTTLESVTDDDEDTGREMTDAEQSVSDVFAGNTTVNLEEMSDAQREEMTSAIQEVNDAVGIDSLVGTVTTSEPPQREGGGAPIGMTAGFYSTRQSTLFINPDLFDDDRTQQEFESGFSAHETAKGTVYHEMAHVKHKSDLLSADRLSEVEHDNFSEDEEALIEDEVSGYASSEPLEFVAEVFAANMERGETYSDEVMELYDDYGGPELPNQ